MSVAEIKTAIDRMNRNELDEVAAHLRRKRWEADTPERRHEISQIMDDMDAGKKVSLEELTRRHAERVARGE